MSQNKLNEKDLEKATGGDGAGIGGGNDPDGKYMARFWYCPTCEKRYHVLSAPSSKTENGIEYFYCDDCQKWYPKKDWKLRSGS